ncbi:nucleotidyl transferase AbiEii/AbiGii toxin family protein [uncultured Acetatifactor sp.]|uniref:nucleotidyl transferase AbiEii/AbiGii toxin family protein n=1 Tax=uncultured Acetatifactor sp. TaxID=1671927 RepID=UPI002625F3A8|nr:nucleotidyl transferase AbiEii/AbiGii toxin family protein [uncultured Acetatifactor sp.]
MKLHGDKFSFLNIIGLIHDVTGIREDILEKDYYVTLLLKELSEKQESLPAYFKGGTALYKARKSIRRFSEDIDLTICIDGCSGSQAKNVWKPRPKNTSRCQGHPERNSRSRDLAMLKWRGRHLL